MSSALPDVWVYLVFGTLFSFHILNLAARQFRKYRQIEAELFSTETAIPMGTVGTDTPSYEFDEDVLEPRREWIREHNRRAV